MDTPFGSGRYHHKIIDKATRNKETEDILQGTRTWTHPIEEVDKWVSNLKQKYNNNELGMEAKKISQPIKKQEFINYFKAKAEKTGSSPSGRHMGHYKSILDNEGLIQLHLIMMNIPLKCGFSCDRWKKSLSVMIEKDKGSPKITRLRIIQLFEADYNMILSTVFGKRMMRFAQKYCNTNENQYAAPGKQCQSAVLNKVIMYDIM